MNPSHRRPLVAYVLVTLAGAVVVAQGLAGMGLIPPLLSPRLEFDASVQEAAPGLSIQAAPPAESADGVQPQVGGDILDEGVNLDLDAFQTAPSSVDAPSLAGPVVSAAPEPAESPAGTIRSGLVGGGGAGDADDGSKGGPGPGPGGDVDDPVFGGPSLSPPGGDGVPGDDGGDGGDGGDDPVDPLPHDFDNGHGNDDTHPYGPAQPPRGPGDNHGQGHGSSDAPGQDKPKPDKPAKPHQDKPDKPAKQDKPGKAAGPDEKQGKHDQKHEKKHDRKHDKKQGKHGKGLAKGQGKVKPGDKGKKNG
jgi:hypothetical protein